MMVTVEARSMIVLITGTSSGIGQATAARLGAAGHTVFAGRLDGPSAAAPPGVMRVAARRALG